jgi:hypothetical protein
METRISRGQLLTDLKRETDLNSEEFLGHLSRLVPLFVKKQVRHKVVDLPGPRTIRFYQHTGVIDPCGGSSRFPTYSYRHILQVLITKLLQSQNLTLRKIAEVTRGSRNENLEGILLNTGDSFDVVAPSTPSLVPSDVAGLPMKAGLSRRDLATGESFWRKYVVAKGLELHVEESFEGADHFGVISAKVLDILARLALGEDMSLERADHPMIASGSDRSNGPIIALVTEGGLVPLGNPDNLEPLRARRFLKYRIAGMNQLAAGSYESVDRGWDNQYVNADPNRLLPVDVMAEMEQSEPMFRVYDYFYTTTGVATTVEECQKLGESIAGELLKQDVSAVIFTST